MTIRTIGMMTAAATKKSRTMRRVTNVHMGMPQHLRRRRSDFSSVLAECKVWKPPPDGHLEPGPRLFGVLSPVGVASPGGGNAASISDNEPDLRAPFSCPPNSQKSRPNLLAVLPRSRFAASLVARLMRSGRLVKLPRASASRTASTLIFGGRRFPTRSASVFCRVL